MQEIQEKVKELNLVMDSKDMGNDGTDSNHIINDKNSDLKSKRVDTTETNEELKQKLDIIAHHQTHKMTDFQMNQLYQNTSRNWDLFYKRNQTHFFKDRHWTDKEFPELIHAKTLLELGCGVGNLVFPLLQKYPCLSIHFCDFSPRAIEFCKSNPDYDPKRCHAFVCDITTMDLFDHVKESSMDVVSCIFCLSAIRPVDMQKAIDTIYKVLKPGGIFLFRDYALLDAAQLRFKPTNHIEQGLYSRHDGTFSFYFTKEHVMDLCSKFTCLENGYITKQVVNRKRALFMDRVFIQSRFKKE